MEGENIAAVALIRHGEETLLIRRKVFPGDPWAGHIAFPGGHIRRDESVEQGMLREVREEVMLVFSEKQIAGSLAPIHPSRASYLTVYPFIIDADDLSGAGIGPEVDDIKIVNIRHFVEVKHPENGFPALDYGGWIVWGLTYRIIRNYLEIP